MAFMSHKSNDGKSCEGSADKTSRRDFLLKLGIGLNVVAGGMITIPVLGYAANTLLGVGKRDWINLGSVDQFPVGATRLAVYENPIHRPWDGDTAEIPCWVRRVDETQFTVFAINCTHLGCPVRWFEESRLFMCPCHGGAFYEDGSHAAGPPPRGLYTYETRINTKSELEIKGGMLPTLANPNP